MNISFAKKVNNEIFNFAREANLSGLLSLIKNIFNKHGTGLEERLCGISEVLAHFPNSKRSEKYIEEAFEIVRRQSTEKHFFSDSTDLNISYSLVIKQYVSHEEKGFLLVSFENQLDKLVESKLFAMIRERYHIVFIPSWTGLYSPSLFKLAHYANGEPAFILPVHEYERVWVNRLGKHCFSLPFNAASWVNHEYFGEDLERDIDCLIVANFASFKRHWLLFKALKGLPKSVTAVCVGVPLGRRCADSIREEARDYGVSDRVEIVENPSQENLRLYFQRAKVFCAMSYREGSFIAVAEALMSGTPVLMFKNAHVGTKNLITPEVGALVGSVQELRERVNEFMEFKNHGKVRQIASESISAQANCRKLNSMLADWSLENGLQWTKDIEEFYSMRLSFYYHDKGAKERLRPDYEYLADKGIRISLP